MHAGWAGGVNRGVDNLRTAARAGRRSRGEDEGFSGCEARSITPEHAARPRPHAPLSAVALAAPATATCRGRAAVVEAEASRVESRLYSGRWEGWGEDGRVSVKRARRFAGSPQVVPPPNSVCEHVLPRSPAP